MRPLPRRARTAALLSILPLAAACGSRGGDAQGPPASPPPTAPLIVVRRPAPPSADGAPPVVGECRRDGSMVVKDRRYDPQPAVPCDQPHGLETWKVATLPERWRSVKHLPLDGGDVDEEFEQAATDLCGLGELEAFLGLTATPERHGTRHQPSGVITYVFSPTPAQWAAGARWIRCDAGFRWEDGAGGLPVTLAADRQPVVRPRPEVAAPVCADRDGYYVPCSVPHVREFLARYTDVTGERPGASDEPQFQPWVDRCFERFYEKVGLAGSRRDRMPAEARVSVEASSASQWEQGDHRVDCYAAYAISPGSKELRQTTGSASLLGSKLPGEAP